MQTEQRADASGRGRRQTLSGPAVGPGVPTVAVDLAGTVTAWNTAAERLFGWSEAEVIGRPLPIIGHADQREFTALLDAVARELPVVDHRTVREARDGRTVPVDVSVAAIRSSIGRVTGIVQTMLPTTPAADAMAAPGSARMEAVGRLAGGVAHDFNNILTAIAGYAAILAADLPSDAPSQNDVAEIRKATDRATRLTRQLLAFGRHDAQEPRRFDLNEVVTDVIPMLRHLIGEHIEVLANQAVELPGVFGDPGQIEQVLVNLVLNARDAMPGGGRLVVATGDVVLDEAFVAVRPGARRGRFVRLTVEDTGTGMGPEVLRHIFEPYFTTKESGRGTGLGLSMAYGIVKQAGGYLWADSVVGRGTTMSVYLPAI